MKKITYLILLVFAYFSHGQTCESVFEVEGPDDTPMVLTINASDLDCSVGTVNSITITDAILDNYFSYVFFGESYCGEYYTFELDIDGEISSVCAEDIIGMEISGFTTLTITSADIDDYADTVYMGVLIEVNFTPTEVPECTTVTGPVSDSENAFNGVLTWESVAGVAGYRISVGTTSGGTDILDAYDAGNVITYNLPGLLTGGVEYFVNITAYNSVGDAIGCDEYNFTAPIPATGSTCQDPLVVSDLPFNATGDTVNYYDTIYEGSPGASGCGSTDAYLGGNDVVYEYTATFDGTITIRMTPTATWSGIFVYDSCENIGVNCVAGVANSGTSLREISEFEVQTGATYYIVISTYPSPQTTAYTLDIIENTCINPTATYAVVADCENGPQFFVEVDVTSLGTATSLTISDNQGSETQNTDVEGVFTFGPYANATSIIVSIQNDQDESCFLNSVALTQAVCPPTNNTCSTAIDLTNQTSPLSATTVGATNSNSTVCNNVSEEVSNVQGDVYYSILVPNGSTLSIGQTLNNYDSANVVFYGDCDNATNIACFDDDDYTTVEWVNETGEDQTVYWVQDGWSGTGTFTLAWSVYACTPAEATYTVVSDCENGDGFLVEVNLTNLGSATSVSVSDDQQSAVQVLENTGVVSFGPYPNNTPVIFTVVNDQDADCTLTSPALNQVACPPANDDCIGATPLEVDVMFCDGINNNGTNLGATDSEVEAAECFNYGLNDVWFSFVVPEGTATVDISTEFLGGTLFDTEIALYSGTCDALVEEDCAQDGTVVLSNGFAWNSTISDASVTVGETYYVRVSGYGSASVGNFCLDVSTNETLSAEGFKTAAFKAYPNPVQDVLNLSYTQSISSVEVLNMLGQQVIAKAVNGNQGQIDMSNLSSGAYLVKVVSENEIKTIKVIKE